MRNEEGDEFEPKKVAAAFLRVWLAPGLWQPSPQVEGQAECQDDAQEEQKGQPGLYKGPDTEGERRGAGMDR